MSQYRLHSTPEIKDSEQFNSIAKCNCDSPFSFLNLLTFTATLTTCLTVAFSGSNFCISKNTKNIKVSAIS